MYGCAYDMGFFVFINGRKQFIVSYFIFLKCGEYRLNMFGTLT